MLIGDPIFPGNTERWGLAFVSGNYWHAKTRALAVRGWGGDSWCEWRGEAVRCGAPGYVVYSLGESVLKKEIPDNAPSGRAKHKIRT